MSGRPHAIAALVALLLVEGIQWLAPAPSAWWHALAGWGLATANGLAAALVNRRAIGPEAGTFARWAGIGHGVRVAILLVLLLVMLRTGGERAERFAIAVVVGYMCFLAVEIAELHGRSRGKNP